MRDAPRWGMTFRAAGSMRFRWNENNVLRDKMLSEICANASAGAQLLPVPLELIHSKIIHVAESSGDTFEMQGDGIVTRNACLLPVVTVADCAPIFLYEQKSGAFGVLHSGWKGTGIVAEAVRLMCEKFGAAPSSVLVAMGAHIRECCYCVDEERAEYFRKNFCDECVVKIDGVANGKTSAGNQKYFLSLEKANLSVLKKIGVPENHVTVATDCTCCDDMFGSFRREACGKDAQPQQNMMTVQAAFCGYVE